MNPAIDNLAASLTTLSTRLTTASVQAELADVFRQGLAIAASRGVSGNALAAMGDAIAELETPTRMVLRAVEEDDGYEGSVP